MSPRFPRRGLCLVLAAPSGAGKTSISRALLAAEPGLHLSISATTRAPRAGEQEGIHYFFRDRPAFDAMIEAGALLEWADVFGQRYGTPRAPVAAALARGEDVLFDIDWQGHRQLRAALPGDVVGVFIMPPTLADLEARLRARGDAPAEITRRMAAAEDEIAHANEFDYCIVNETLAEAIATTGAILRAARAATARQTWLAKGVPG
ncbi:MAG: guanylate kinase [Acidibrevibacterium sp.]|jgi:guanylate kinase|uniref:guanylate kinase n=1 Tax=Acidibrevibacterium fodinaquatile TaxID=1969806 RepID=UPI000E0D7C14|nr:guanylate kinase [Acidibrevibacterium fodinaquatile]MCA7118843.1 guanylate kinase [Acidibrevibacterium fodinaquatile]